MARPYMSLFLILFSSFAWGEPLVSETILLKHDISQIPTELLKTCEGSPAASISGGGARLILRDTSACLLRKAETIKAWDETVGNQIHYRAVPYSLNLMQKLTPALANNNQVTFTFLPTCSCYVFYGKGADAFVNQLLGIVPAPSHPQH